MIVSPILALALTGVKMVPGTGLDGKGDGVGERGDMEDKGQGRGQCEPF